MTDDLLAVNARKVRIVKREKPVLMAYAVSQQEMNGNVSYNQHF
jgi:hypothetical protein